MWEFKVDNNANIANFACLWKTRLYVVFFTVMAICQKEDLNNESGLDLDELYNTHSGYSFTAVILIPSSTPDLKLLKHAYYIGQVKATRLDNISMTSSSDVSAIEKRSNSFRKHVEDGWYLLVLALQVL